MYGNNLYPALQMTNACNKNCRACLRSANTVDDKIKSEVFAGYLRDIQKASELYKIQYQFVTGGEPTIWKEPGKDITDILISLSELELIDIISMPTNGKVFEDLNFAREFFTKLSRGLKTNIITGISIADYQENLGENGYIALDNLITISSEPGMKFTPIIMVTLSVEDNTDKRLAEIYPGIFQRVTPLAPLGYAAEMDESVPSLNLAGKDKSTLGAFLPHFVKDIHDKLGISTVEVIDTPNYILMDKLSHHNHCGCSPFIDSKWNYCLPLKDDTRFNLCSIGDFETDTIGNFLKTAPLMRAYREEGILTAVNRLQDKLKPESQEKLDHLLSEKSLVPVAYRGCMICKSLYDLGIVDELNTSV